MNGKIILKWYDSDNQYHEREYTPKDNIAKARKWLIDNGATGVDVAYRVEPKQKEPEQ